MSKVCSVCQKGRLTGHKVSHSNRKANRVWEPNLQKIRVKHVGRAYVCTTCLKSGKVERA